MKNEKLWVSLILGVCFIIGLAVLGSAYRYKFKSQDIVTVTGLGEQEFTSDLIVWRGALTLRCQDMAQGYAQLERNKAAVSEYIRSQGLADSSIVFMFVNVNDASEPIYAAGQYVGQRKVGYDLRQEFSVESSNVEVVEEISREISALIAQGIAIESWSPEYYYSGLSEVKLALIERATADARQRAEKIAEQSGASLGGLRTARMGVFQITGANTNDEFSAGGSFDTSSKRKKARITMRLEYQLK